MNSTIVPFFFVFSCHLFLFLIFLFFFQSVFGTPKKKRFWRKRLFLKINSFLLWDRSAVDLMIRNEGQEGGLGLALNHREEGVLKVCYIFVYFCSMTKNHRDGECLKMWFSYVLLGVI